MIQLSILIVVMVIQGYTDTVENSVEVPQKITELLYDPAIPLLGIEPEELKSGSERDIFTPMFTAALFTIAKTWKQPKCPMTDEWEKNVVKKKWYIHIMDSAFIKKEILPVATTLRNLEDIMLSEISQTQKDKCYIVSLICGI